MRILVVEDEPKMATLVARGLREEGHAADIASRGEDALWMANAAPYDAIVLDVMLPGLDGFATCRQLRKQGVWAPVLMLTARDAVGDRVGGLDAGADDYLLKPFSFAELLARLRALVRRCAGAAKLCPEGSCSKAPGSSASRAARISSTSTSATCATRSTGRSAAARSRPCAASATASAKTAELEPPTDPSPSDAPIRGRDGDRARRGRILHRHASG